MKRRTALHWPESIGLEGFLHDYWQRRPLLMRAAFPGFEDPVSPAELAGLATEDGIEARLVTGANSEVCHGPFPAERFASLPERDWTLLVQRVDQALPAVADLLDPFRFAPNWRLDDVMVSYAAPGGGVGAHVDRYDVFLIQGGGRRRWSISHAPVTAQAETGGGELDLLTEFDPEEEWVLEPGDVLYLPPGVPHCGVALEPALTYSVGFRAPALGELVADFVAERIRRIDSTERLADAGEDRRGDPGAIDTDIVRRLIEVVQGDLTRDTVGEWFGRFATRPAVEPAPAEPPAGPWRELRRSSPAHFAHRPRSDGGARLFVGGEAYICDANRGWVASWLSGRQPLTGGPLARAQADPETRRLLEELLRNGYLYAPDEL